MCSLQRSNAHLLAMEQVNASIRTLKKWGTPPHMAVDLSKCGGALRTRTAPL